MHIRNLLFFKEESFFHFSSGLIRVILQLRYSELLLVRDLLFWQIGVVDWVQELKIVGFLNEKIKIQSLKYFCFQLDQLDVVYTATNLEGLVIVVDFIVKLGCQKQTDQEQFVDICPCEDKVAIVEIVPIDIDEGDYQTFWLEVCLFVNTLNVSLEVYSVQDWGIEISVILSVVLLLLNKVLEKRTRQKSILLELLLAEKLVLELSRLMLECFTLNFAESLFLHYNPKNSTSIFQPQYFDLNITIVCYK